MPNPTLIIMAAGLGSRYGELKPLAPVGPNGESAVAYSVHDALKAGFGRIVFVIRKAMEAPFRERVGRAVEKTADTAYVFQELDRLPHGFRVPAGREKPWGTGHAHPLLQGGRADALRGHQRGRLLRAEILRRARRPLESRAVVLHGRLRPEEHAFAARHRLARNLRGRRATASSSGVTERTQIRRQGDSVEYADGPARWVEIPGETIVSMNMWGFTPEIFGELERRFVAFLEKNGADLKAEYYIPSVVGELVREGKAKVRVLKSAETWFGLTYPEDLPAAQQAVRDLIRRGVYPEQLQ